MARYGSARHTGRYLYLAIAALLLSGSPASATCTALGTLTTNLGLCQPASGETGWASAINGNYSILDALFVTGPRLKQVNGGTGIDTSGVTNGQLLIGATSGNTWALATLTGTTNQVTVTNGANSITLSAPQNLHAGATPSFAGFKDTNGLSWLSQTATASAVNGVTLANAATGNSPSWTASGTDSNIGLAWATKGTGTFLFGSASSLAQLRTTQQTAPTCTTNCGGSPSVAGTDSAGVITIGSAPSNAVVLAFNGTWAAAPSCTVTQQTTAANYVQKAISTTTTLTITLAAGPTAADKLSYLCVGTQ